VVALLRADAMDDRKRGDHEGRPLQQTMLEDLQSFRIG